MPPAGEQRLLNGIAVSPDVRFLISWILVWPHDAIVRQRGKCYSLNYELGADLNLVADVTWTRLICEVRFKKLARKILISNMMIIQKPGK